MKVLLIVIVLGAGGPATRLTRSVHIRNATVTMKSGGQVVAASTNGRLTRRVRPGLYTLEAVLRAREHQGPNGTELPPDKCQAKSVQIRKRPTRRRVVLYCPTP